MNETIPEKTVFSGLSRISDTAAEFPSGRLRWDSFSTFGASLRPSLLKLRFGPEKLINSALFTAGGNYTLELINN